MDDFSKGIEQFNRKLQQIADNAEKLDGEHAVPFTELFPDAFMLRHTRVGSFQQLLEAGGFGNMEFAAIPDEAWDATVRGNTSFANWDEMKRAAATEWAKKRLLEGSR